MRKRFQKGLCQEGGGGGESGGVGVRRRRRRKIDKGWKQKKSQW